MRGTKAKQIRKAQRDCQHEADMSPTRHKKQVRYAHCRHCGIAFDVMVPARRTPD